VSNHNPLRKETIMNWSTTQLSRILFIKNAEYLQQ